MNRVYLFIRDIYCNKQLLYQLTKRDFEARYFGSALGTFWAFAQPFATIFVMFLAFEFGLRVGGVGNVPFFLWLSVGMIPWFFIAECIGAGSTAIESQAQIIKKVVFRISLLPLVKINTALLVHLFFIVVLLLFCCGYGFWPSLHFFQVFYYLVACIFLMLGLGWLTSSIVVFYKDMGQVISIILQMGVWGTPIFWQIENIPDKYEIIMKLNPAYYIVNGYREALIYKVWFWEHWKWGAYYWFVSAFFFILGITVFKKLKKHFADVL